MCVCVCQCVHTRKPEHGKQVEERSLTPMSNFSMHCTHKQEHGPRIDCMMIGESWQLMLGMQDKIKHNAFGNNM